MSSDSDARPTVGRTVDIDRYVGAWLAAGRSAAAAAKSHRPRAGRYTGIKPHGPTYLPIHVYTAGTYTCMADRLQSLTVDTWPAIYDVAVDCN